MARPDGVLTTRGQSFLAAGIVLLAAGIALGLGDLVRIGLLLVILAAGARLLARRPARWVRTTRTVTPPRLTVGEPGTVTLTITNAGRWRSPLVVAQEQLDYALGDRPRFVLPGTTAGARQVITYPIRSAVRGEHELGPLSVRVRDSFGLTSRLTRCPQSDQVLVTPQVLPLGTGPRVGSGPGQDEEIADIVALHGEDDVTIREYRQGDELRRIHWPASAHTGTLMVRQEEQPSRRRAAVLVDLRREAHTGQGPTASVEWAVTAAASAVAHLADRGYDVLLLTGSREDEQQPVTVDRALEVLTRADLGSEDSLVTAADHLAREQVGLVVAVLAAGPGHTSDDPPPAAVTPHIPAPVLDLRRPGTTTVALVVDTVAWATSGGRATPASPHGARMAARLRDLGWRSAVALPAAHPAEVWAAALGGDARSTR